MSPDFRPAPGEPAVRSPELLRLVQAARAAPPPVLKASSDAVFAGFQARRRDRRRLVVGATLAVAAAVALIWARPSFMSSRTGTLEPVATNSMQAPHVAPLPVLAEAVRVVAEEGPPASVRGEWQVELGDGRYDVTVAAHAGPELLRVDTAGGTVEIAQGRVVIVVAGARTEAVLRTGVATWIAPGGARTPLAVAPAEASLDDAPDPRGPLRLRALPGPLPRQGAARRRGRSRPEPPRPRPRLHRPAPALTHRACLRGHVPTDMFAETCPREHVPKARERSTRPSDPSTAHSSAPLTPRAAPASCAPRTAPPGARGSRRPGRIGG